MFEKFGEFDSAMELNVAAATALEQGNIEDVKKLAEENGIDVMDAQDYIDGMMPELCTPLTAALGKLAIEKKAYETMPSVIDYWIGQIQGMAGDDPEMAAGIRKKGKELTKCLGELVKEASKNRVVIPKAIAKAAGLPERTFTGDVDRMTFRKIVTDYYKK